jgi:hypothetical protein
MRISMDCRRSSTLRGFSTFSPIIAFLSFVAFASWTSLLGFVTWTTVVVEAPDELRLSELFEAADLLARRRLAA